MERTIKKPAKRGVIPISIIRKAVRNATVDRLKIEAAKKALYIERTPCEN